MDPFEQMKQQMAALGTADLTNIHKNKTPSLALQPAADPKAGQALLEWIPTISDEFQPPWHLREWCDMIERCLTEPVRGLCAVPIRHYKTETTLHGVVWLLVRDPTLRIILLTHSHERAVTLGKRVRQLARQTSIGPTKGYDTIEKWQNDRGGGVQIMSAAQSRLGEDCHVLIFDDPLDEIGSMNPEQREAADATIAHYTARCMRKGRRGSVLGVMSRWHPDDPIGRRLHRAGWQYVSHPAIVDLGLSTEHAFAPDVWPLEELKKTRAEWAEKDPAESGFWAQLQNDPKPPNSRIIDPARYHMLPDWPGYRDAIGLDCQYSESRLSDWGAICAVRFYGSRGFIRHVERFRLDLDVLAIKVQEARLTFGGTVFTYVSGPEVGTVKYLAKLGIPVAKMIARYNKLVRGQRTIDRWNGGQMMVPGFAPWADAFIERVKMFRGIDGDDDDEFDAMVSVHDGVLGSGASRATKPIGQRRI